MTTISFVAARATGGPLRAFASFFSQLFGGVREGLEIWDRYDRLSRRSDHELRRYGLERSKIAQAAARGFDIG